jgi:hypothetical protein
MAIRVQPYLECHKAAVAAFNRRIAGSIDPSLLFPEDPRMEWLPEGNHPVLFQQGFVATEDDQVRGAYILKRQEFLVGNEVRLIASYRLPVSEGLANRAYAMTGLQLIRDAIARQPLLFSLGMGSADRPLPRMQKSLGWKQSEVPFYFKVLHGGAFARNIRALRGTPLRRAALGLAAATGTASAAVSLRNCFVGRSPRLKPLSVEEFSEFGPWADDLWSACSPAYTFSAVRNRNVLATLYPAGSRFLRWKLVRDGKTAGWAVGLDTRMSGHKQFGNMRVGTIVDGFAHPADAALVIAAATRALTERGVDLIISNQAHLDWCEGLRQAGFLQGPSNFIFSASPALSRSLEPFDGTVKAAHINRGDGDGPINL